MSGYVYILTNPSFRDDWVKIGKSSRPVNIRSKELDNTAVPLPFEIYATLKTEKYEDAEKQIHGLIDLVNPDMRIRKGREFFNVTPEKALSIFQQCARTLDDAEVEVFDSKPDLSSIEKPHSEPKTHKTSITAPIHSLTFEMINIPIGAELSFVENEKIKATVVNNRNLIRLQDGTEATLSKATRIVKDALGSGNTSGSYRGGSYWLYNGQRLTTIREQIESANIKLS